MGERGTISLHIGQAGIQMGSALWELLSAEHYIGNDGYPAADAEEDELHQSKSFFNETAKGMFVPRSIMVDLEPIVVDEIRTGYYRGLFHADSLISGFEDAANNFARGFFTIGNLITSKVTEEIRRAIEACDSVQSIMFYRSLGGGTGSGLTAALFDYLSEFSKTVRCEVPIYPSPTLTSATVEPINCILGQHFVMDDVDLSFLIDNEALYDIYYSQLLMKNPTLHDINRLIALVCSSATAPSRFPSIVDNDLNAMTTNLIPFPRIHFPLINLAPVASHYKSSHENNSTIEIINDVFKKQNQLVRVDPSLGRYMSCSLLLRGDISIPDVYQALGNIKNRKDIKWVDWLPTAFKVGLIMKPITTVISSKIASPRRSVTMLTNSSVVGQAFHKIVHRFHVLYNKRAFVHWFVGEGLEEVEFSEALLNLANLVKDYEECSLTNEEVAVNIDNDDEPNEEKVNKGKMEESAAAEASAAKGAAEEPEEVAPESEAEPETEPEPEDEAAE